MAAWDETMKNPLWNHEEKRLRALWRLVLFVLLVGVAATLVVFLSVALSTLAARHAFLLTLLDTTLSVLPLVGILWLAGRFLDHRPFADYGFHFSRAWWLDFAFGLGLGALLMALIFSFELVAGWLEIQAQPPGQVGDFWPGILEAVIVFTMVAIREEIFFRAYPLRNLAEGLNWKWIGPRGALIASYILTSFIFGLAHLGNPNASWVSSLNIALGGILLGAGLVFTGEMAIPIALHLSWNFFQGNVFGFPVSGIWAGPSFVAIRQGGPELLTGGAFGPEAGLLGLFAMLLGFALTVGWVRYRRGSARLHAEISCYRKDQS
jgi:uncharacterized protein